MFPLQSEPSHLVNSLTMGLILTYLLCNWSFSIRSMSWLPTFTTPRLLPRPNGLCTHPCDQANLETDPLSPQFLSPFPIKKVISPSAVKLKIPSVHPVHSVFRVPQVKPVTSSPLCPPVKPPSPTQSIDGHPTYTVQRILDVRPRGHGQQYLVDWKGYGPDERGWVPCSFILDGQLIADFEGSSASTSGRRPGGVRWGGGGGVVYCWNSIAICWSLLLCLCFALLPSVQERGRQQSQVLLI